MNQPQNKASQLEATLSQANVHAASASFAALVTRLDYLSPASIAQIKNAYRFADEAHLGQFRKNGEPYITHPISVAALCADWKLDQNAVMAALLHDTMEDCDVSKTELTEQFGLVVADLVDGLTKLDRLRFTSREETQAESFRKMLLAMARDVRVILIKVADRLHNMRTLSDVPASKWGRIASETLDIYAPIAHRLGLNVAYRELQDLSFAHLHPWRYGVLKRAVAKVRQTRHNLVKNISATVQAAFDKAGLKIDLAGREKTIYSIYCKMNEKRLNLAEVYDIFGFRLLLEQPLDCYTAIGVLHQLYPPIPGKFKDHIAIPKSNGYQSLHTVVAGSAGILIEFQTRTHFMHTVAESGLAAHWMYKAGQIDAGGGSATANTKWLQSLLDIQASTLDSGEFWDHVKVDLFPDAVYVFTPKNRILALPRGATVVDFAYAIHSNIGDHAIGANINNEAAALRTELHNGDMVEVITSAVSNPNPAWLDFVRTGRARARIRHHLKTLNETAAVVLGEKLLLQALRVQGIPKIPASNDPIYQGVWDKLLRITGNKSKTELLSDIGLGKRIADIVAKKLASLLVELGDLRDIILFSHGLFNDAPKQAQMALLLDGSEKASVQYASCCRPIPGDEIVGYMGKGDGLVVHSASCAQAKQLLQRHPERFTQVEWSDEPTRDFICGICVKCTNAHGSIAKIATIISNQGADIVHIDMDKNQNSEAITILRVLISLRDKAQLSSIISKLNRSSIINDTQRM